MAVVAGSAEAVDRVDVLGCAISLVRFPEITGMARGEAIHEIVAQRLGDHRCRRNRVTARIAIDDRFMLAAELRTGQAIDEHPRRREAEPLEGPLHGENRRPPDVVAIDLAHARGSYSDGERAFTNLVGEPGALQRRQHFRVVQAANRLRAHRKDDGRGYHWSRQRAAADFVDSSNGDPPLAPERDFALERRTAVSHVSDCSAVSAPAAPARVPARGTVAAVRPGFSRMRAVFPASRRRKYNLARRTRPFRSSPISAIEGACSGKIRSTPTPAEILRTVNVSLMPPPRRAMQMPSNACRRSFSPSRTRTITRTVSPGANAGMSVFTPPPGPAGSFPIPPPSYQRWRRLDVPASGCRVPATRAPAAVRASAVRLARPAMSRSCRGRHSTILPGRR